MTRRNFGRTVELVLGDRVYTDLAIMATIEKSVSSSMNSASIEVHNLPEDVYTQIRDQGRDLLVEVYAGYQSAGLIFRGNPVKNGVESQRDDGDFLVTIEAKDGLKDYQDVRLSFSVAQSTTLADLVDRIAEEAGIDTGAINVPGDIELNQGVAKIGSLRTVLDPIARATNSQWSIQNGRLQFTPREAVNNENTGPRFSPDLNNLLEAKRTDEGTKFLTLLESDFVPGDRFVVEDWPPFNGAYKATSIDYSLSSGRESDFYCDIDAEEYETAD